MCQASWLIFGKLTGFFLFPDNESDDPEYLPTTDGSQNCLLSAQTRSKSIKFLITSVGDELEWTVPCFPVLSIHFVKLSIEIDGKTLNGLVNQDDFNILHCQKLPCEGTCCSHCQISIDGAEYTVLWKWELLLELPDDVDSFSEGSSVISCISETDMSDDMSDTSIGDVNLGDDISDNETDDDDNDDDDEAPIFHTLPFKVMGVAHTNQSQTHLTRANLRMYEEHEEVTAHLEPEPQNERNADAISVQIDYGNGRCHVGYIARELTKFIHPLLNDNAITRVEIGDITFSVKWLRIGFYMKLLITRVGRWHPYVVYKAMRVK